MTAEHCHDLFCTCESCRQSRSSDSHDPMATSCAALEGPGPYLPAAVATMLGWDYLEFIAALYDRKILLFNCGVPGLNQEYIDSGILEERRSMDFYGFKRVQALITQKGVDYLTEILGTRKKDEDSDGGQ